MELLHPDLSTLARELFARRDEGVVAPYRECRLPGWSPQEHACHVNVDYWVARNHGHKAVRGWLCFDWATVSEGALPIYRFSAHSLVQDQTGVLFDLTPSRASQRYPFIRHGAPDQDFKRLVVEHAISNIDYIVR